MIKEQDKAIERCNKLIETEHSNWIGITNQKAIETVLNMLKEKDAEIQQKNTELAEKNAEIEKYKKLLADNLARNLNDSIKAKEKANTDLEFLNLGWKTEIEKKDKMIDLMAEWISERCLYIDDYGNSCEIIQDSCNKKENCELCIKQYFERKVENERI